jgi:hypothetical protein
MTSCWLLNVIQGMLLHLLASMAIKNVGAFSQPPNRCQPSVVHALNSRKHIRTIGFLLDNDNLYSPTSKRIHDMEEMIISLCFDPDDSSRRLKLSKLFEANLLNKDGGNSFIKLFDQVLIIVGDRMRLEAENVARQTTQNDIDGRSDGSALPSFPFPAQQKSLTEGRLWACIDMMVQSKILVKQAKVKLGGSEGFNR